MSTEAPRNPEGMTEDELWAALDGQVGAERASTLTDIIQMILERSDYETALPLADAAVEAAADSDNEQMQARAASVRGFVYYGLDRFAESGEDHLRAAKLYERYDSINDTYLAYFNASWSFELAEQYERALEYADIAITTAAQLEDSTAGARAHEQRADVLIKLERPEEEILEALSRSRQAFRQASNAKAVLRLDERVARRFENAGDYDSAVNLLRDCVAVAETVDAYKAAHLSYLLGHNLRLQGKYAEAIQMLQKPLAFNIEQQNVSELGSTYFELAHCEWRLDNNDEAFAFLAKARAHLDMAGTDIAVRDLDETRSIWLHVVDRYDEAIAVNHMLTETTTGWMRFMARARLADNYRCKGDATNALAFITPEADDADYAGWPGWFWREAIRARTLELLERNEEAWEIARTCIGMDMSKASAFAQATLCELMGDSYYMINDADEDAAHNWWARAVALYLQADVISDARRLSAEFLPDTAEEQVQ